MATKISSADALLLLKRWKDEGTTISSFCVNGECITFSAPNITIGQLSDTSVRLSLEGAHIDIALDGAGFYLLEAIEIPERVFKEGGFIIKNGLQIINKATFVIFVEAQRVIRGSSSTI